MTINQSLNYPAIDYDTSSNDWADKCPLTRNRRGLDILVSAAITGEIILLGPIWGLLEQKEWRGARQGS